MNGKHASANDVTQAPPSGGRKGHYVREKWQRDATFVGTILGEDPAKSLIEELKRDQQDEEKAEADRFERELVEIETGISDNEAEAQRVVDSTNGREEEGQDLRQRLQRTEESLRATEAEIVEKSGELLKARSQYPLLAIKRRREQREALDGLRAHGQSEHEQQELEEFRRAKEQEADLSRSSRGSVFSAPVAVLLMWIGAVGLLVFGWWIGERIRTVVDAAAVARALDGLGNVTTSLLDGGVVWRALLGFLLLMAVAVPGVRRGIARRILPAKWADRTVPDDPVRAGGSPHVSIPLVIIALPLLAVAAMGLLFGGTEAGPMLSTFVGAAAFTFAGVAFCAVIAGATAFWVAAETGIGDGESSQSQSMPRSFRWILSVCLAVVVLLEGIRMVRMEAYDLFTLDHAFLPILMTPLVSICLLWGAICLGRDAELQRARDKANRLRDALGRREADRPGLHGPDRDRSSWPKLWEWVRAVFTRDQPPSRTRVPYIVRTRDDRDLSPQLVGELDSLESRWELGREDRDRLARELERLKAKGQEARESLARLRDDGAKMRKERNKAYDGHQERRMKIRRLYREQLASLALARSMGIRARSLPHVDALRNGRMSGASGANGKKGF